MRSLLSSQVGEWDQERISKMFFIVCTLWLLFHFLIGLAQSIQPPPSGQVSLGEFQSQLYTQSNNDYAQAGSTTLDAIPLLQVKSDQNDQKLHPSLFKENKSSHFTEMIKLIPSTPPLPPLPPYNDQPIVATNQSIIEKMSEWTTWALHHSGIRSVLPYQNTPLPASLSYHPDSAIRALCCHPYQSKVAIALSDDTVRIYDFEESRWKESCVLGHQFQLDVLCLEWKPLSGTILAVGCRSGVLIWDGEWMTGTLNSISNVSSLQWSPVDSTLAIGSPHHPLVIWDTATGVPTSLQGIPPNSSYLVRWSPNGHYIFQASLDGTFTVWESLSWTKQIWTIPGRHLIQAACWSADSHYLLYSLCGRSVFFCFVFDHLVPRIDGKFYQRIPLSSFKISTGDGQTERVCGQIADLKWNATGDRLMVSFCSHMKERTNNSAFALFSSSLSPQLHLDPLGFLRVPQECSLGSKIAFCEQKTGCLALIASNDTLSTMTLQYRKSQQSRAKRRKSLFVE